MPVSLPPAFFRAPLAHRALHDRAAGRIENSPSAVLAAIEAGYGIEIDLQLSSDGVPMVFHDDDLDRLTHETGRVNTRTCAELQQIVLRDSTETIPTLAQILDLVAGRAPLLIELKDQTLEMGQSDGALEEAAARILSGYTGQFALMSFNPTMMANMARLLPKVPRGLTTGYFTYENWPGLSHATCDRLREIPDYDRVDASFISHSQADLTRQRVLDLKAQGANILCWTVKSPEVEAMAREVAENITFEGYLSPIPA